ncbi:L%2CD-carboxypeptidase A [Enterobacter ludwigii]|nr:L%2CD-carboxypeptidase A [Enterobacter ludwigii]
MSQFHLIAPSGYCINQDAAQRGVQRLLGFGHQVENQTIIPRRQQRFAGTEAQRLNDINSLVNLKGEDRIVLAVRGGGYGASRLLESIDWQGLAQRQQQDPLLICGHSDFTAIQLGLLALHNVITFSGPMLAGNFGAPALDAFTLEHFWRALRNPTYSITWQGQGPHWACEGQLWGGVTWQCWSRLSVRRGCRTSKTAFWCWKILTNIRSASSACYCSFIMPGSLNVSQQSCWAVLAVRHPMITTPVTPLKRWLISSVPVSISRLSPVWILAMSNKP